MDATETSKIDGWEITPADGVGRGPNYRPIPCFVVVGPHVRTETRVDFDGLKDILPEGIYTRFLEKLST